MSNGEVVNNAWFKLAVVSLVGIVLIFAVLWGINTFNGYYGHANMNIGNGYHYGMQQGYQNDIMQMQGGMNNMGGMNMQGGMNMNGGMQGGMGMHGMMGGMKMNGNMQGGMGMMGGM